MLAQKWVSPQGRKFLLLFYYIYFCAAGEKTLKIFGRKSTDYLHLSGKNISEFNTDFRYWFISKAKQSQAVLIKKIKT